MSKSNRNLGLDPETQYVEINRNLATYEFPWDINQALSFALFRTYAVPSIGRLLGRTGAFTEETQKRYDDTAILLEVPLLEGFDSENGKAAVRRINQMHRMYDISNEDFVYVLSTFVVVPNRWIQQFGWRRLTDAELLATVRYYQALGRHMGIKDIPATYAEFETLMDGYEDAHFAFDPDARRVADATLDLLASFYPSFAKPVLDVFSRALMDDALLTAFRLRDPGPRIRAVSERALKLRARLVALLPPRRKPRHVFDMPRIRSYPNGFDIRELGTFVPGCPVHRAAGPA
ncbi:oxygenase MpaB family protein [Rhodococcus sp. NPDC003318]|uniref:oxygenase MpaB family protein n=1 Tax=Rhodococcus sp. NPDC003318 TaxID=3364503 RepID=UPI0036D1784B